MRTLESLGWNPFFEQHFSTLDIKSGIISRVIGTYQDAYLLYQETETEVLAEITGKFRYEALSKSDLPVVGDWVLAASNTVDNRTTITHLFPRQTKLVRQAKVTRKGKHRSGEEQILAANIDVVFIVASLNQDLNLRRLERYLIMVAEAGARPIILLSKSDLCKEVDRKIMEVQSVAFSTPVHPISVYANEGLEQLQPYLGMGATSVLVGSSGTGKSTLINWLMGEAILKTQEIRQDDDKGKHTTTSRYLLLLPDGSLMIDTPGIRELQFEESQKGIEQVFGDIQALKQQCRFSNCLHQTEPGCAVKAAIEEGSLDEGRFDSYVKLTKENAYLKTVDDKEEQLRYKKKVKKLHKQYKRILHEKRKRQGF